MNKYVCYNGLKGEL